MNVTNYRFILNIVFYVTKTNVRYLNYICWNILYTDSNQHDYDNEWNFLNGLVITLLMIHLSSIKSNNLR